MFLKRQIDLQFFEEEGNLVVTTKLLSLRCLLCFVLFRFFFLMQHTICNNNYTGVDNIKSRRNGIVH